MKAPMVTREHLTFRTRPLSLPHPGTLPAGPAQGALMATCTSVPADTHTPPTLCVSPLQTGRAEGQPRTQPAQPRENSPRRLHLKTEQGKRKSMKAWPGQGAPLGAEQAKPVASSTLDGGTGALSGDVCTRAQI